MVQKSAAVVGGGLVGCLTAAMLQREGYHVDIYEGRGDPRIQAAEQGIAAARPRSINLAVSARGITALEAVDKQLADKVLQGLVPLSGRMIHHLDGKTSSQAYGLHGECINSIDRELLNNTMLTQMEHLDGVKLHFDHKLQRAHLDKGHLVFNVGTKTAEASADLVVGCDGAYSKVRHQMQRCVRMDYSQNYIDHSYLELAIPPGPPSDGETKSFSLNPHHLHIWPRHRFMLIALPNDDKSFTCTLFAPESTFQSLKTEPQIIDFFSEYFSDALPLIGREALLHSFAEHPLSPLMRLTCSPYHYKDRAVLLGDSSHCMPPFYGQGMNCGFEDVRILQSCLRATPDDLAGALEAYTAQRHKDLVAIQELALNNYNEMSSRVVDPLYLLRKQVDGMLTRVLGEERWCPLYTMVTFKPDIMYSEAVERESWQQSVVTRIVRGLVSGTTLALGGTAALWAFKRWSR